MTHTIVPTMRRRAKLICVIGLDGSGKTTLARALSRDLQAMGLRTAYLHFWPRLNLFRRSGRASTSKSVGKLPLRRALGLYALSWFLLHVRLRRLLRRYDMVICDRYVHDLAAYLALRGHAALGRCLLKDGRRVPPDLVLVLRVTPKTRRARKGAALEFPFEIYGAWEALYDDALAELSIWKDRTHLLNADGPFESVFAQARRLLHNVGVRASGGAG